MMEITNIQIAQGIDKRDYLTSNEYLQLMGIANESTLLSGYAVFEACGMLGIHPIIERNFEVKTRSSIVKDNKNTVSVYPNPATNSVSVSYSFEDNISGYIQIYSVEGKLLLSELLSANSMIKEINTIDFDNGIYFYSVYTSKGEFVDNGKIIILK
jgi:hypothetical protein